MSKKTILLIVIIIVAVGWLVLSGYSKKDLVNPNFGQILSKSTPIPSSTPIPPQAPKTFKFDSSTDLKKELDSINPQILDSDFE